MESVDRRISKGAQADSCGQTEHQVSGNTHGGCLGERKHTVSLHYGCNGVDHRHHPTSPTFTTPRAHPRRVHRARWLAGAPLPLAFIYNQIPCIPATDARLNFYPRMCTRGRASTRARSRVLHVYTIARRMPDGDGKSETGNGGERENEQGVETQGHGRTGTNKRGTNTCTPS